MLPTGVEREFTGESWRFRRICSNIGKATTLLMMPWDVCVSAMTANIETQNREESGTFSWRI